MLILATKKLVRYGSKEAIAISVDGVDPELAPVKFDSKLGHINEESYLCRLICLLLRFTDLLT